MRICRLDSSQHDFEKIIQQKLARGAEVDGQVFETVREILKAIELEGDDALLRYTNKFDQVDVTSPKQLEVQPARLTRALSQISYEARTALELSAQRINEYHAHQLQQDWSYEDAFGTRLMQRVTPVDRAGVYVPGGLASYPSSVLMNVLPAKVAGVKEVVMVVPAPRGEISPLVLAAAQIAGVDQLFTVGGAQAIGALAYGTDLIAKVDKIVGPGNQYVATAKRLVFGHVGIDMVAGPSEILIVADETADPQWVAWDMMAQAEHDPMAQSILLSSSSEFLEAVSACLAESVSTQPRAQIIAQSLEAYGLLIKVANQQQALTLVNKIASEHLQLMVRDPQDWLNSIRHAGSILVGPWSAVAMGDYSLGSNHVLPTVGGARFSSPLGVADFQKRSSVVTCSPEGAVHCGQIAVEMARGESLEAHARSALCRVEAGKALIKEQESGR